MNTGENDKNREVTEDELHQVTSGGPDQFVEGYYWANGDLNYGVRTPRRPGQAASAAIRGRVPWL